MQDFIDELSPANSTIGGVCRERLRHFAGNVSRTMWRVAAAVDGPLVPDVTAAPEHP
jgi:hypothetical protein